MLHIPELSNIGIDWEFSAVSVAGLYEDANFGILNGV